jgi:hypothetical protein
MLTFRRVPFQDSGDSVSFPHIVFQVFEAVVAENAMLLEKAVNLCPRAETQQPSNGGFRKALRPVSLKSNGFEYGPQALLTGGGQCARDLVGDFDCEGHANRIRS